MISVQEADILIKKQQLHLPLESVSLADSVGRVLREPLVADRDFPPFDRVTMDGVAIRYSAFANGTRSFPVDGVGAAGAPQIQLNKEEHCLEIMTGAVLPKGTDTVIRYEDVEINSGVATLQVDQIRQGQNIHCQGEDRQKNSLIVQVGVQISPAEIAIAATIGKDQLLVSALPKVAVISTGDELVKVSEKPAPHQIRSSNAAMIKASLEILKIKAHLFHLPDEPASIETRLNQLLIDFDVLILSGGVSKGKFDFLPEVLAKLSVQKHFHKVKQRPGKPFWFGSKEGVAVVFALPGNPVSSFSCLQRYVCPWLSTQLGITSRGMAYAKLTDEVNFKPDLTYFVPVKLSSATNGSLLAKPIKGNGSGDLANLTNADGFIELPAGKTTYDAGQAYLYYPYR